MGKIYKDDVGTEILLNCGIVITTATNLKITYQKPGGTEGVWSATLDGTTNVKHIITSGELNEAGIYKVQSGLKLGSWEGRGETAEFIIYDDFG